MRGTQTVTRLVAAFVLMGLLAGCGGQDPTPTSTAAPPTATPTPLPPGVTPLPTPTTDTFAAEWDALIAAAQVEREVFLALGGSASRYARAAFAEFERQFGVRVVSSSGSGMDNVNRILAERTRGVFTVDVITFSGGSLDRLRSAGYLNPVSEWLIHRCTKD